MSSPALIPTAPTVIEHLRPMMAIVYAHETSPERAFAFFLMCPSELQAYLMEKYRKTFPKIYRSFLEQSHSKLTSSPVQAPPKKRTLHPVPKQTPVSMFLYPKGPIDRVIPGESARERCIRRCLEELQEIQRSMTKATLEDLEHVRRILEMCLGLVPGLDVRCPNDVELYEIVLRLLDIAWEYRLTLEQILYYFILTKLPMTWKMDQAMAQRFLEELYQGAAWPTVNPAGGNSFAALFLLWCSHAMDFVTAPRRCPEALKKEVREYEDLLDLADEDPLSAPLTPSLFQIYPKLFLIPGQILTLWPKLSLMDVAKSAALTSLTAADIYWICKALV